MIPSLGKLIEVDRLTGDASYFSIIGFIRIQTSSQLVLVFGIQQSWSIGILFTETSLPRQRIRVSAQLPNCPRICNSISYTQT